MATAVSLPDRYFCHVFLSARDVDIKLTLMLAYLIQKRGLASGVQDLSCIYRQYRKLLISVMVMGRSHFSFCLGTVDTATTRPHEPATTMPKATAASSFE